MKPKLQELVAVLPDLFIAGMLIYQNDMGQAALGGAIFGLAAATYLRGLRRLREERNTQIFECDVPTVVCCNDSVQKWIKDQIEFKHDTILRLKDFGSEAEFTLRRTK